MRIVPSLLVAYLLAGCGMTRVTTTWKAPDVHTLQFKKIVALVVVKDEAIRRNAEHQLCERITRIPCAPAFAVVEDVDRGNVEKLARQVDAAGFDGAVVLRYAGRKTEETYVPPVAPLWGYYGYGYGMAYDPGYVRTDELLYVETTVYDVKERKLLWAATTESLDPRDVRHTVDEIVDAVTKSMRQEGLIPSN